MWLILQIVIAFLPYAYVIFPITYLQYAYVGPEGNMYGRILCRITSFDFECSLLWRTAAGFLVLESQTVCESWQGRVSSEFQIGHGT